MRVLFLSHRFWPSIGGREIFGSQLACSLQDRGFQMMVLANGDGGLSSTAEYKGIPIKRLPLSDALIERDLDKLMEVRRRLIDIKRAFLPDLIHIHGFDASIAFFHFETSDTCRTPLLVTLTEEAVGFGIDKDLFRRTLRSANWITSKSSLVLTRAYDSMPEIASRSCVIENGIKCPALAPTSLPTNSPTLLCLGRLVLQKGFDLAVIALASIVERFPQVRLILAGDGTVRQVLERQIAELGLVDHVEFRGWIAPDEVPALMNEATIVVLPSRWEGLPSVALQAAMMARPIVATRVGGIPEVVVHQETGLLVEPEDVSALAAAIAFLLMSPEIAVEMGSAGRRRVQEIFSWDKCVGEYEDLYRQLARHGERRELV
jgi:glycogen synthase